MKEAETGLHQSCNMAIQCPFWRICFLCTICAQWIKHAIICTDTTRQGQHDNVTCDNYQGDQVLICHPHFANKKCFIGFRRFHRYAKCTEKSYHMMLILISVCKRSSYYPLWCFTYDILSMRMSTILHVFIWEIYDSSLFILFQYSNCSYKFILLNI